MPKPMTCDATKGGCGNHFLVTTNVFAADMSGPLEYDSPLLCWGCNSIWQLKENPVDGSRYYQRYANVTTLAVLRQIQPPPGTFE